MLSYELQQIIVPLVEYTLLILSVFLALFLTLYLVSVFVHAGQLKYAELNRDKWSAGIDGWLKSPDSFAPKSLNSRERGYFEDVLRGRYRAATPEEQARLRGFYKSLDCYDRDIRTLRSRFWWRRVKALERLEALEFAESEPAVFPLLEDRRAEVRFSALRALIAVKSPRLGPVIVDVFSRNDRWAYRYLVNKLFAVRVPVEQLRALAESGERDLRKAGAILLGQAGNGRALELLSRLVDDTVKDVRREAVLALGRVDLPESLGIMAKLVNDPNPQVRIAAAKAAMGMKSEGAVLILAKMLADPDFEVRYQTFHSLNQCGQSGQEVLNSCRMENPDSVREFLMTE